MVAETLFADARVRKISFTGSTEVGKELIRLSADQVKRLSLELGGHAPYVIFDDADLEEAVDGLIASKFRNAGQTCVCANRIYVQRGIYDEVRRGRSPRRSRRWSSAPATSRRRHDRAADRRPRGRQGRRARAGRDRATAPACVTGGERLTEGELRARLVLRADRARRRHPRDADLPRGDVRPGRGADAVRDRGGGDRARPTTRSTGSPRTSTPATTRGCCASPRSSSTGSSAPTRASSAPPTRRSAASRSRATAARAAPSASTSTSTTKYVLVAGVGI